VLEVFLIAELLVAVAKQPQPGKEMVAWREWENKIKQVRGCKFTIGTLRSKSRVSWSRSREMSTAW
jgi:hypothetical protein